MRYFLFLLALTAAPYATADTPSGQVSAVSDLASLLEGEFTTQPAQQETANPSSQPPLYDLAKLVDVPALGPNAVYAELREGTPSGKVLRQRLYALKADPEGNRITMTAYDLGDAPTLVGAYRDPTPLAKLDLPNLHALPAGCEIIWHKVDDGFEGETAAGRCPNPAHLKITKTGMDQSGGLVGRGDQPAHFRRVR